MLPAKLSGFHHISWSATQQNLKRTAGSGLDYRDQALQGHESADNLVAVRFAYMAENREIKDLHSAFYRGSSLKLTVAEHLSDMQSSWDPVERRP
jgi:hypothetical protein